MYTIHIEKYTQIVSVQVNFHKLKKTHETRTQIKKQRMTIILQTSNFAFRYYCLVGHGHIGL
jgi:hypothetical protein